MTIKEKMAAIIAAAEAAGGMTAEMQAEFDSLEAQLQSQNAIAASQARLDALGEPAPRRVAPEAVEPEANTVIEVGSEGIERDPMRGFADVGEFAQAVKAASHQGGYVDERLRIGADGPTTVQRGHGDDGGYMVPPQIRETVWNAVQTDEPNSLMTMVDQEPTSSNSVEIPSDESTPWGGSGVRAYWGGEAKELNETKADLGSVQVKLSKVHALVPVSDELLTDGPRLSSHLQTKAPMAVRYKINEAIYGGDGVGKPLGMLRSASKIAIAKETGQTAATVVAKNIQKMYVRMAPESVQRAVWLINFDVMEQLLGLQIGDKPVFLPPNGMAGAPFGMLLGRPVFPISQAEGLGTEGDIMFIDPMGYYLPVKQGGIKFAQSMHLWFDHDVEAFRWTSRVGGRPYLSKPIVQAKSAARSHIVALATRS